MIRWNGWGKVNTSLDVPPVGAKMLKELVGDGRPKADAPIEDFVKKVPESLLPDHPLVSKDPRDRVEHSHGQSLPDWIAMRWGAIARFPDAVAYPTTEEEILLALKFAKDNQAAVIPFGGGTSAVGHLSVPQTDRPVLSLSLERYNRLVSLDRFSSLAVFESGVRGPEVESLLRAQGYTLGHYPQSFELSSLGGWVVTRSSGQQSMHYGRMDGLFQGGVVLTPRGRWVLPPIPASGAGPDLRQFFLGSEGRLGVLSTAAVKVSPIPEIDDFYGVFFPAWSEAVSACRELACARLPLSMIRLSNPVETMTNLALSGHSTQAALLKSYLRVRGIPDEGACMCLIGVIGSRGLAGAGKREAFSIARRHKGVPVGKAMGRAWEKKRFLAPYLRNSLWDLGYAVDTLETCVTWDQATGTMNDIEKSITDTFAGQNEKAHVFTHLSHVYPTGSSVYTTFVFRLGQDPESALALWREVKGAASRAIVSHGGTISHQHGVGVDHQPYLQAEKGALGMEAISCVIASVDPEGRMNPGKLVE